MYKKNYLISVILTNYNGSRFLKKSINSVLNQTYKNLELIIIDDCSTDSSEKIIKHYKKIDKRIRFFLTKKNSGNASLPRNLGISKSKGRYVAFIDADDYWYSDKLRYQILNIKNYLFSFTAANYQHEGYEKKSGFLLNTFRIMLQKFFMSKVKNNGFYWLYIYNPFLLSSVLIDKKTIAKNKFELNTDIREDLQLWLNLFQKLNKKFIFHSKILVTITRAKWSVTYNRIEEFNRIINNLSNTFLKIKKYDFFYFFILGIFFRSAKLILINIFKDFKKKIKKTLYSLVIIYFIIYYSPLFYLIGQKLIYYDPPKKTEALIIISGQQGFDYYNDSYKLRFIEALSYLEKFNGKIDTKIFLYGKLQSIPDQKILEALLLSVSVKKDNIIIFYDEYKSMNEAVDLINENIKKNKITDATIMTSPYNTYRLHKFISSKSNKLLYVYQNTELPKKNNFFERSFNKKEIIYEYFSLIYNKIKGNFNKAN
jgi:teichuronic acid biosynthesis glycosyltransferase TuaG